MSLPRPQHAGMRHVALNVLDLALVESFYVDLLGFEVEWRPDEDNVYLSSGVDNLALHVPAVFIAVTLKALLCKLSFIRLCLRDEGFLPSHVIECTTRFWPARVRGALVSVNTSA